MNKMNLCAATLGLIFVNSIAFATGGHVGGGDSCKNEIDKNRLAILNSHQRPCRQANC